MLKKYFVLLGFAIAVWAFCGALVGLGRQVLSMEATLILHALGAPAGAAVAAWVYFRRFAFTDALSTAAIFVVTALTLDLAIVAPLIERSFAMFASPLGVWIPMALIFAAVLVTGSLTRLGPGGSG